MEKVKVIAGHFNSTMRKVGDEYETTKQHAAQLKAAGLVEWDGEAAAPAEPGAQVLYKEPAPEEPVAKPDPTDGKGGAIKPVATIKANDKNTK